MTLTKIAAALVGCLLVTASPSASSAPAAPPVQADGRPVVFAGTLVVSIEDDFVRGRATKHFALHESNLGRSYEVRFRGKERDSLRTGMRVRVRGTLSGDVLIADTAVDAVTVLESAAEAAATPGAARRVVVLLVDVVDGAGVQHAVSSVCDGSTARSAEILFGQNGVPSHVDGCYQDSSFGAMGWGGSSYPGSSLDVVRVTISDTTLSFGTVCNYSAWATAADSAATGLGMNLGNYQHRLYVVPADAGCGWAGLAFVGCGSSCRAWIKAYSTQPCGYADAYAHELGHNVGFYHASTDTNNDGTVDCEYCDDSDFMGYAEAILRTQNGPHKLQMGWVNGSTGIVDGSAGGQFTIAALEQGGVALPQILKITPGSGRPYYLSYRVPMGYDASIPQPAKYANRANIHRWDGGGNTLFVSSLGDGQSFVDSTNAITITQDRHDASTVTITVSTTPALRAPTVSLSPAAQGTNTLPATRSYVVSVTNSDSATSSSSVFGLAFTLPAGWIGSIVPESLSLAPGLSGTATLSVTAPVGTADGAYAVRAATVADAAHSSASASATYSIDGTKPSTPWGLTASPSKRSKVTLSWNASSDNGGSGVALYRVYRNGAPLPSTTTTTTCTDTPGIGTWTYTVRAQDGAGNLSDASNAATVTIRRK